MTENETWSKPKQQATGSIQVGNIHIPTGNSFSKLVEGDIEGGDLIPSVSS